MELLTDKEISASACRIAYYMLSCGNHGVWRGTNKFLADKLHIHPSNISKYISQLKDKGYIIDISINGLSAYKINPNLGE